MTDIVKSAKRRLGSLLRRARRESPPEPVPAWPAPPPPPVSGERFAGSRALVTGAGAGIGLAIAEALIAEGADVVGIDRDWSATGAGFAEVGGAIVERDLALVDPEGLAGELLGAHGSFDLIVNNVGVGFPKGFLETGPAAYDRIMATNLRTPWFLTRRLVEDLIAHERGGAILFIGSLHSRFPRRHPSYSASKAAITMLVREMAAELGPSRIRVNLLAPGWVSDPARERNRAGSDALSQIPLGRPGLPQDLAPLALDLLDDRVSGYVTGAELAIDGGLATHTWIEPD